MLCLLALAAVVVGFQLGSHRGGGSTDAGAGGDGGVRLLHLHRVETADADVVMEWTEENLSALARRSPQPPVSTCAPSPSTFIARRRDTLVLLQRPWST